MLSGLGSVSVACPVSCGMKVVVPVPDPRTLGLTCIQALAPQVVAAWYHKEGNSLARLDAQVKKKQDRSGLYFIFIVATGFYRDSSGTVRMQDIAGCKVELLAPCRRCVDLLCRGRSCLTM